MHYPFNPQNNIKDQVLGSIPILKRWGDFPGGQWLWICFATQGRRFILGQGTRSHAVEQLSLHVLLEKSCCNKRTSMLQIRPNTAKKKKEVGSGEGVIFYLSGRMKKLHIQGHTASEWDCQNLVLDSWGPGSSLFMCSLPRRTRIVCFLYSSSGLKYVHE